MSFAADGGGGVPVPHFSDVFNIKGGETGQSNFGPKMFQNRFLFFSRFGFLNMPTFHLSQYFYDICLIFMQMKTFFEP